MAERWVRAEDVLWRAVLDGVVLLPPDADEPIQLNGTGAALWALLAEPVDVSTASSALAARYTATEEEVAEGVTAALRELAARGAVEPVG